MYYKQLLLALGAILIVVIFFKTDCYSNWYDTRFSRFLDDFSAEVGNLDYEHRRVYRWDNTYDMAKFIKRTMGPDTNELLIIPTVQYTKQIDPRIIIPEPITLYYFTGLKSIYPDNKYFDSAKFAVFIDNKNIKIARIKDEEIRRLLKAHYAEKTEVK